MMLPCPFCGSYPIIYGFVHTDGCVSCSGCHVSISDSDRASAIAAWNKRHTEKNVVKPITPAEVLSTKKETLPEAVFEIFNDAIAKAWDGYSATIDQESVALKIANKLGISTTEVYKNGYMDIEPYYRESGWRVKYDKPGFNENYKAYYEFLNELWKMRS